MASKTVEDLLFPEIGVRVEHVSDSSDGLVVEAMATGQPGRCPDCRKRASRVHSSYQRTLDERPLGDRRVMVRLRVRRYFCDHRSCARRTLVEQVGGLTERHRRSSVGLTGWLRSIAAELGGRAGERLCRRIRLAVGRSRLLGLLEAPPVPDRAPRVLGVDEFAFRKGCTYGIVLVDVEAGRVVDVLPDRTSETFAAWLKNHPGPDITRACALARAFADLVRHRRGFLLLEWIRQAEQDAPKPMQGFAGFLRQDLDAVTAGLTLPWSSGIVEGHVNRVKTLKRAMYGRASFELLRTRILTQP
ncbi:transposase [Streptomyces sp. NBC_00286]|nr:transposase [Streptomyces sp. NBC_00286]